MSQLKSRDLHDRAKAHVPQKPVETPRVEVESTDPDCRADGGHRPGDFRCVLHSGAQCVGRAQRGRVRLPDATKQQALEDWLSGIEQDVVILGDGQGTVDAIRDFSQAWDALGAGAEERLQAAYITDNPNPTGQKDELVNTKDGTEYAQMHAKYHEGYRSLQRGRGYYDLFLFDLKGNLIYSVFKELDYATNFNDGLYAESGLGEAYRAALSLSEGAFHFTKFAPYAPSFDAPAKFVAAPVFDNAGQRVGVVALQAPLDQMTMFLSRSDLLGETGLVYAVGDDGRALSASPFEGGHQVLDELPASPQVAAAQAKQSFAGRDVPGLSGNPVVARTISFEHEGSAWSLVLEQDMSEAFAVEGRLLATTLIQVLVVAFLVSAVAFVIARLLTRRIVALSNSVSAIANGDFSSLVAQTKTGDELGDIARAGTVQGRTERRSDRDGGT